MRSKSKGQGLAGVTNLALMAPVRDAMVDCEETITYVERLQRLLNALHSARRNQREAELDAPVFPETIGRFGVIQQFRYAIWPPLDNGDAQAQRYLTLNVSFDGGWEPYMRVIYRDIGPLLDALLCHCSGYPGSRNTHFDDYCRWVRDNEMDAGLFYTDSAATAADARYLAEVERIQREGPDPAAVEQRVARFALPPFAQQRAEALRRVAADPVRALALPVRTLKGLYRLAPFFGNNLGRDDLVLKRFARLVLREFSELMEPLRRGEADPGLAARVGPFLALLKPELDWLLDPDPQANPVRKRPDDALVFQPDLLQDMVLNRTDPVTHGALVMLQVDNAAQAAAALQGWAARCGPPADNQAVRWHISFSHAGLQALKVSPQTLDLLPPEFAAGMEARCALLGDLRSNHPEHWLRPQRHGTARDPDDRVDMASVHVVVVLRLVDPSVAGAGLHPKLASEILALQAPDTGLTVLAVEPTRSRRPPPPLPAKEHFGFVDGLSQPTPVQRPGPIPSPGTDEVSVGELLMGYGNDRGDGPLPAQAVNALLKNGSFLVVRKLRQRVDRLEARVDASFAGRPDASALALEARARMMGRSQGGQPLLSPAEAVTDNSFNYDKDPEGRYCPHQSHVRRANPRDGREYMPRILRRGMSYGPARNEAEADADRGAMFMAYCGSIAEQFEVLQRWMAGGNSSGLSSAQADPFLAVPRRGERRTFRYLDGQGAVQRVDLGDQPLVELQWGLYLFVPSMAALQKLVAPSPPPEPGGKNPTPDWDPAGDLDSWRLRLEDEQRSQAVWAQVRAQPVGQARAEGYGQLVGSLAAVRAVVQDPRAEKYSVAGYGLRMTDTIGLNLLGLDPGHPGRAVQAKAVNPVIEAVTEAQAFKLAWPEVQKVLQGFKALEQPRGWPDGDLRPRRPIELITLSEQVLGLLCRIWFGLPLPGQNDCMVLAGRPDAGQMGQGTPRCPGELFSVSRNTFAPHPNDKVQARALLEGPRMKAAVAKFLAERPPGGTGSPNDLTQLIINRLNEGLAGQPQEAIQEVISNSVAGMLLGFPPTVHGNFLQVMKLWIEEGTLWPHQRAVDDAAGLQARQATDLDALYDSLRSALRPRLMATMRRQPVPAVLWRCPVDANGGVDHVEDRRVVVGIRSALAEVAPTDAAERGDFDELMFGGSRCTPRADLYAAHACPGYGMGVGVLLALLGGLLLAGDLRSTGSPVLLMLTPPSPSPP